MVCLVALLVSTATGAGRWDVGGKVSVLQDGEGVGLKTVITAEYHLVEALSWRTDLEVQFLEVADGTNVDISVPTNLLWYPLAHRAKIDPYMGPGLSYTYTHDGRSLFGANMLAGVTFLRVKNKRFGIEAKYNVADVSRWTGSDNLEVGLTGSWEFTFGR